MARFKATIQSTSGKSVSRLGPEVATAITGWFSGVEVQAGTTPAGRDVFYVYATGGLRRALTRQYLGVVSLADGTTLTFTPATNEEN
jgi:hypothetical protein